ncbi:MAG: inositol monophosphatase [Candidatus Tectomicrobia bacterium]|uniref:Inositol monophosphatase n=1 Tax=Tectimicrobiota bacterium TaxID=2528274 RepID=A0A932G248_UNCTE|nr:inositol monophosphatase [Candidatus Tectomicrobia bacterium]
MSEIDDRLLQQMERFAIRLASQAGEILLKNFGTELQVEFKDRHRGDPVTRADRESQEYLREAIHQEYPDHGLLGEEDLTQEPQGCRIVWVLDPLDGTKNFLNGLPIYGVSIGVLHEGRPVVGAISLPTMPGSARGIFHARQGGGAFLGDCRLSVGQGDAPRRDHLVSLPANFLRRWRFCGKLKKESGEVRSTGSVVYEMAHIACATFYYAIFGGPRIWDVAAGILLVKEAQGQVLVKHHRAWQPFTTFDQDGSGPSRGIQGMREWQAPIIAGNANVAWLVASSVRRRFLP